MTKKMYFLYYENHKDEMTKDELDKELAYTLVQNKPTLFTNNEDPSYVPKDDHTPSGIEGILSRYKK